jgi:hypothetical protein
VGVVARAVMRIAAKNQDNRLKTGKSRRNTQENCGNRAFDLDFLHLKAAL